MVLNDKTYILMKWAFLLGTPLLAFVTSFIDAVATKDPKAIATSIITGVSTLAGCILKVSDSNYKKSLIEAKEDIAEEVEKDNESKEKENA